VRGGASWDGRLGARGRGGWTVSALSGFAIFETPPEGFNGDEADDGGGRRGGGAATGAAAVG